MIELVDRLILDDGTVLCSDSAAIEILYQGKTLDNVIMQPSDDVDLFNKSNKLLDTGIEPLISTVDQCYTDVNWYNMWLTPDSYSKIDIQDYCLNNKFDEAKLLINNARTISHEVQDIIDVNYDDGHLLILAVSENNKEMFNFLIDNGADVQANDDAALRTAAHKGNIEFMTVLIGKGAKPEKLIGTTSYNNHEEVKNYLDSIIKK